MVDDEYRRTPPEDSEWAGFWRMKKEWDESRESILDALTLIRALGVIKRALPYAVIITIIGIGALNADLLSGLIK